LNLNVSLATFISKVVVVVFGVGGFGVSVELLLLLLWRVLALEERNTSCNNVAASEPPGKCSIIISVRLFAVYESKFNDVLNL